MPDVCSEDCEYYPCFMATPNKECGLNSYDDDTKQKVIEIFRSFYGEASDFRRGIINMAVRIYVDALQENDTENMMKILRDIAYIYKILYGDTAKDSVSSEWEKMFKMAAQGDVK